MMIKAFLKKSIKLVQIAQSSIMSRGLRYGVAASTEHKGLISNLDVRQCIDIGSNKGQFALLIRGVHPEAEIYAFEPLLKPFETLEKVFSEDTKFHCFNVAVGQDSSDTQINVSASNDSSSLLEITDLQVEIFPGTQKESIETIAVRPLKNYIEKFKRNQNTLLKIDVQGYELEVLQASACYLSEVRWVYVEASFKELYKDQAFAHEVITFLSSYNFRLTGVYNAGYSHGYCVQGDFLFERDVSTSN